MGEVGAEVDDDEAWDEEEGAALQFFRADVRKRKADDEDAKGDDWSKDGRDVDGEVHGDVVQHVAWLGPDGAVHHVRVPPGYGWDGGVCCVQRWFGDMWLPLPQHLQ